MSATRIRGPRAPLIGAIERALDHGLGDDWSITSIEDLAGAVARSIRGELWSDPAKEFGRGFSAGEAKAREDLRVTFDYVNWRGDSHTYVIDPEGFEFAAYNGANTDRWYLHGQVVTRDGDPREDMGPTRRRSFEIDGIKNLRPAGGPR